MTQHENTEAGAGSWNSAAGGAVLLFAVFLGLWWNRFLGISLDGWFQLYGEQIRAGQIPYRDFYLFSPPLPPLTAAAISASAGTYWWVFRVVAMLQRLVLLLVVFFWLKRAGATPAAALVGSVFALTLFCCDIADPLFYYHQDSVFYCVLAGFCATRAAAGGSPRTLLQWSAGAGLAASLAFLTKQTTGLGITLVIFSLLPLTLTKSAGWWPACLGLVGAGLGWLSAPALVLGWLARHEALGDFVDQVFIRGPSSKGPLLEVLLRPFWITVQMQRLRVYALLALALVALLELARRRSAAAAGEPSVPSPGRLALLAGLLLLAIVTGAGLGEHFPGQTDHDLVGIIAIYGSLIFVVSIAVAAAYRDLPRPDWSEQRCARWLLGGVSLSNGYFLSLSWPAFEPMVVPGLAFFAAHYLTAFERDSSWRGVARLWLTRSGILISLAAVVAFKAAFPFHWGWFQEPPIVAATKPPALPQLKHLYLAPSTCEYLEAVTAQIREHSSPSDPIFVFPHMPIFYLLADRSPCSFAYVHFWDVCPDYVAQADAAQLRAGTIRPQVLVLGRLSSTDIQVQEFFFRSGQLSGQRELLESLEDLKKSGDYQLVKEIEARGCMPVGVWARIR